VPQNDLVIANQSAPDFRSDLNDALQALGSLNSGPTAPSTTYANMLWYDTSNNILKMRSEADDAWIDIGTLNQSTNAFEVAGLTTLAQSVWEAGTDTTEALVSPAKVKAAVEALGGDLEALAEGASGAPKIQNRALGGISLGSFDGGNGVYAGLSDLDDIAEFLLVGQSVAASSPSVTSSVAVRLSDDNGATWESPLTLESGITQQIPIAELKINLDTGDVIYRYNFSLSSVIKTKTANLPTGNVNAFQIAAFSGSNAATVAYHAIALKGRT